MAALCVAAPADAATRRARARRPAPKPAPKAAAAPKAPAIAPVRNVILFVANGYTEAQWREARAARADGLLAMDRMPVAGFALPPAGVDRYSDALLAATLAVGRGPDAGDAYSPPLLALARQYGRAVALVAGRSVGDALPGGFVTTADGPTEADTLRRLAAARVDVLFGRDGNGDMDALAAAGYHVAPDAPSLLEADRMPAATNAPGANVPFDTLTFRALHIAAKAPNGLMMAVAAAPDSVSAAELNDAITTALAFARRDGRTLALVASRHGDAALSLYAEGPGAEKFSGTLAATDVPKIVAGVAGLKVFRRDFSPLFAERAQPTPSHPAPVALRAGANGTKALPW